MRSIIVRGYLDIVLDQVHRSIQESLSDIEEFCRVSSVMLTASPGP